MTGSNCGKRIKLIFVHLNYRIDEYHIVSSVTERHSCAKSAFAPTFYSLLHQMSFSKFFSVVNVNSILSLNQMKTTLISNSFKQLCIG